MNQDAVRTNRIEWLRVVPELHLLRSVGFGFRVRVLLPAFFLFTCCWGGLVSVCSLLDASVPEADLATVDVVRTFPWNALRPEPIQSNGVKSRAPSVPEVSWLAPAPIVTVTESLSRLVTGSQHFDRDLLVVAWCAIVMALFATAIGRSTATGFCTETRTGPFAAMMHSCRHLRATAISTALAAFLITAPLLLLKLTAWLATFKSVGWMIMISWPVVVLISIAAILTTLVVSIGWLLSLAAVATDECTGTDALSRGINYVLSHKTRTAIHFLTVLVLAGIAQWIAAGIVHAGVSTLHTRFPEFMPVTARLKSPDEMAETLHYWWHVALLVLPQVVRLGVFFSGTTLIYILLRQKEDGVRLRELDGDRKPGQKTA